MTSASPARDPSGRGIGGPPPGGPAGAARRALLLAIQAYQALHRGRPSPCRFYPTCSAYAAEAVEEHGAWRGSLLAVRRVARCRPGGGYGVDLVPLPGSPAPSPDRRAAA